MSDNHAAAARFVTPILSVRNFSEAVDYYTNKLLFELKWQWGQPPSFGCVGRGKAEIFFSLNGRGRPCAGLMFGVLDVDEYCDRIAKRGAEIVRGPLDEPWGMREIHVCDPNEHVLRFGHGISRKEAKVYIDRVAMGARIEKRLASVVRDLAGRKMSFGPMLGETHPHSFDKVT